MEGWEGRTQLPAAFLTPSRLWRESFHGLSSRNQLGAWKVRLGMATFPGVRGDPAEPLPFALQSPSCR